MGYLNVPRFSYKNEASFARCVQPFTDAFASKKHIVWLGDSMSTLFGGAGRFRGNALARVLAGLYGALPQTPLLFERMDTNGAVSVPGTASNIGNTDVRVTATPAYLPNMDGISRALSAAQGVAAYYDPWMAFGLSSDWRNELDAVFSVRKKVMQTTGNISARVYVTTNPSAGGVSIYGRTYESYDTLSNSGYTLLASGLSNGQAAAQGDIKSITQALTMNLTEGQIYALQALMTSGTATDYVGTRFIGNDTTSGVSYDMFGHGGDDADEYYTHHNAAFPIIPKICTPDLLVVRLGMNDSFGTNTTYNGGLRNIITKLKTDVPGVPIWIIGTTMCNDVTYNGYIDLQPAIAQQIAADYDDVTAYNTCLDYNPAVNFNYTRENITVATAWANTTSYVIGDNRYTPDNRKWKAKVNHTSSATNAPPSGYWDELNVTTSDGVHQNRWSAYMETKLFIDNVLRAGIQFARPSILDILSFKSISVR